MKKILSFVLALCMICTLLPAGILTTPVEAAAYDGTFEKYSGALTDGYYLITYNENAMKAAVSNNRFSNGSITNGAASVTNPDASIVWKIEKNGDYFTLYNESVSRYAAGNGTKNQAKLESSATDYSKWTVTGTSTYEFVNLGNSVKGVNKNLRNNGTYGFACYSTGTGGALTLYKLVESTESDCDHANATFVAEQAATCTVDGVAAHYKCSCGQLLDKDKKPVDEEDLVIPADHKYVNGTCSVCGQAKPKGYIETEASKLDGKQVVVVTMTNSNGTYALTNDGGTSTAPTATMVTVTDGMIAAEDVVDNLKWNVTYSGGNITIYPNGTTATWLYCTNANNGVRVGTNTSKVFTIDAASGYLKHTGTSRYVGIYNNQDWRCYTSTSTNIGNQTLKFYVLDEGGTPDVPACEHTETVEFGAVAATCTTPGKQAGVKCANPDCGHVITEPTDIPALGHNYVDGECAVCHTPDPFINLPGRYYIAAFRNSESKNYYLTSTLTSTTTKRYTAVAVTGALPTAITNPEAGYVFVIVKNSDGTYSIQAEGVEGNNYLGWTSGNSGALQAADADHTKLIPVDNGDGTYSFGIKDTERVLALNEVTGNNYFAWYAGTQVTSLKLIPVIAPIQYTDGSVTKEYYSWDEELNNLTSGTITLLGNVTAGEIDLENTNVVLNLNGKTLTVNTITANVMDTAPEGVQGLIKADTAKLSGIDGYMILWDDAENAGGYRAFHYTMESMVTDNEATEEEGDVMVKTFWNVLRFENSHAYTVIASEKSGLNRVAFELGWNGVTRTYDLEDSVIYDWATDEETETTKDFGFYIRVTGFENLETSGAVTVNSIVQSAYDAAEKNNIETFDYVKS